MKLTSLLTEEKKLLNSNGFRKMYEKLDIAIDKLGCVMLDIAKNSIPDFPKDLEDKLYTTENKDRFWIKGFVGGNTAHVTLLYGLMESAKKNKKYVDEVLDGWSLDEIEIDHVDCFESPYADDPYYCIVAHVKISDELKEGRTRLELLPHINTFPDFKAHVTIAYVEKNDKTKKAVIDHYNKELKGKKLKITEINYGK